MYNTGDLAQIESAILKLQSGERVVSVAYGDHASAALFTGYGIMRLASSQVKLLKTTF